MGPEEVLKAYEERINRHDFEVLAPLISPDALFWFNDGSHSGIAAVRGAFMVTWASFPLERYWLEDMHWIAVGDSAAACTYHYRWDAVIDGKSLSGGGRGTSVLRVEDGHWKIIHEHLSQFPQ